MSVERRLVFLLIDGIGDVALPQLCHCTPLQVADTPIFDSIAACGLNGLMDSVEPGLACGSDTSHLGIFGYEPRRTYRGRGAFESIGAGCSMEPGDIAFKSNLATLNEVSAIVTARRVDRTFDVEGPQLCRFLDGTPLPAYPRHSVEVKYATEHRCGVVIKGPGLSDNVTGTDPLKDNLPLVDCVGTDASPEAQFTAELVNYVSNQFRARLRDHPINAARRAEGKNVANVVLLRGCGVRLKLTPFQERHGLRACIVAPTKILGGTTGSYDSAFHRKGEAIAAAVGERGYQFGFVHVKAVDDCGHDRLWGHRVRYLEIMDALMGQIIKRLRDLEQGNPGVRYAVLVTGDHSTPVMFGDHSFEPVPVALAEVTDVVQHLGADAVDRTDLGPLPALSQHVAVSADDLWAQAEATLARDITEPSQACTAEPQPANCAGDGVQRYSEIDAAAGCLGRFPSSELMPLITSFLTRS